MDKPEHDLDLVAALQAATSYKDTPHPITGELVPRAVHVVDEDGSIMQLPPSQVRVHGNRVVGIKPGWKLATEDDVKRVLARAEANEKEQQAQRLREAKRNYDANVAAIKG